MTESEIFSKQAHNKPTLFEAFPRGLCAGVAKADDEGMTWINTVREIDPEAEFDYIGFPAHNTHVTQKYVDANVRFIHHVSEARPNARLIFGPHGLTDEDEQIAKERGHEYLNTECPLVTKVKNEIKERTERGISTLYHGKRGHTETRAAMSAGNAILFETEEEALGIVKSLKEENPDIKLGYAGQTTHNADRSIIF